MVQNTGIKHQARLECFLLWKTSKTEWMSIWFSDEREGTVEIHGCGHRVRSGHMAGPLKPYQ